jgi:hypothetical protein
MTAVQGSKLVLSEVKNLSWLLRDPSKLRMREARTLNLKPELSIGFTLEARK